MLTKDTTTRYMKNTGSQRSAGIGDKVQQAAPEHQHSNPALQNTAFIIFSCSFRWCVRHAHERSWECSGMLRMQREARLWWQPPAWTKGKRRARAPPWRSAPRLQGTGPALPQPGLPTLLAAAQHQLTAARFHCRQCGSRNKAHKPVLFYISQPLQAHTMFYCMLQKTDMNKAADSQTTDGSCNRLFSTPTPLGLSFLSLWLCFSNNQQQENKEDLCTCLLRLPLFPLKHNSKRPDTGISSVSCCLLKTHCC